MAPPRQVVDDWRELMKLRWLALAVTTAIAVTLVLPSVAFAPKRPLFAALNGQNEIGEDGRRGAGDRNGGGSFSAVIKGDELCYGLAVRDIRDPVAAHIHRGRRNQNGPIVVPLTHPENGNPGAASDCAQLSSSLIRAIRRNPGRYYVNVHTGDFQDGAIRGQLFSRGGP
jgi:CHRD domain